MYNTKRELGQFYTTNAQYILSGLIDLIPKKIQIIDPFAGNWDILNLFNDCIGYDLCPQNNKTIYRDSLVHGIDYTNKWIATNPPFLSISKSKDKSKFETFQCNDLYLSAIKTFIDGNCSGGIIILPFSFFSGNHPIKNEFLCKYKVLRLNVFNEQVFSDTRNTICSFVFLKNELSEQKFNTHIFPDNKIINIQLTKTTNFTIGYDFFILTNGKNIVKRLKYNHKDGYKTNLYLHSVDTNHTKINLSINKNHYVGKDGDRCFASIVSDILLSAEQEKTICKGFNDILNCYRDKYCSLFLPCFFRYNLKRIPFDIAFGLISNIIRSCS